MFVEISSNEEFIRFKEEPAVLFYFSTDTCNVCKVLKPKVDEMIRKEFPKIEPIYINSNNLPEVAAQNRIFVAPTIIVFFSGREYIRKSRNIGIEQLRNEISRPYSLLFS